MHAGDEAGGGGGGDDASESTSLLARGRSRSRSSRPTSTRLDALADTHEPDADRPKSPVLLLPVVVPESVPVGPVVPDGRHRCCCGDACACVCAADAWYCTEDWWSVWAGVPWYLLVVGVSAWGLTVGRVYAWSTGDELATRSLSPANVSALLLLVAGTLATLYVVHAGMRKADALWQYAAVCIVMLVCKVIGANTTLHGYGLGDAVWCVVLGVAARALIDIRSVKPGSRFGAGNRMLGLEFFIKTGIVLLAISMRDVGRLGARALVVSWLDTLVLVVLLYVFASRVLRIAANTAIVTACALSICGASAAMAIKAAIGADEKMTAALIALMSFATVPLIPVLPLISTAAGFNAPTAGAWIGGAVDSTGGVSACASLLGADTFRAALVVKMLQNLLIGPVALGVTSAWSGTCRVRVLWDRFPKFVFGFILVSCITTALPDWLSARVVDNAFMLSEWFSNISFVLIGLDMEMRALVAIVRNYRGMIGLYFLGQLIDLGSTLGFAFLMFTIVP